MGPYVGLSGQQSIVVSDDDSALTTGSGDVPTLATPRVVALAEAAAIAALDGHLEEGQTSVGTQVSLRHRAPSPVGRRVEAIAALTEVDGHTLRFTVTVRDGDRTVAEGLIERVIVDRDWFLKRA